MLEVSMDRDSVHAGDDMHSHETSIIVDATATLRALLNKVQTMGYLPSISEHFADTEPRLLFRYWCQKNPDQVFSHIKIGNEPPSLY